ncbi:MAG: VldV, partial [Chloroflexi bacterium]
MSWSVEGTYFENCNCDFACPCLVTSFAAPAT